MDRGLEPQLFCRTCSTSTTHETMYRSDNEFIGKILVCEHCGETVFEPLRTGCADCWMTGKPSTHLWVCGHEFHCSLATACYSTLDETVTAWVSCSLEPWWGPWTGCSKLLDYPSCLYANKSMRIPPSCGVNHLE